MKKWIAAMLALPASCLHAQTLVNNFNDIQFWTGVGTNRAALVIQWPGVANPTSVVWGYRWNGEATALQMIFALAGSLSGGPAPLPGSDPRLEFDLTYSQTFEDYFVDVIRFDQLGLGGAWTPAERVMPGYDGVRNFNALYFRRGTSAWTSALFEQASTGPAGITLQNGTWIGWIYADGSEFNLAFAQPYAAPSSVLPPIHKPEAKVSWTNGVAVVSVMSQTNHTYQLAFTGTLGGTWTNQPPVRSGNGGMLHFTNSPPVGASHRFYRVVITR